jgi:plastocyanin
MGSSRPLVAIAAAALLVASTIGLVQRKDSGPSGPAGPGRVQIAGFAFGPADTKVAVGGSITWLNGDNTAHTVDSEGSAGGLDSDSIAPGATYTHTFDQPGTYTYFCAFHPFMQGRVEVTG